MRELPVDTSERRSYSVSLIQRRKGQVRRRKTDGWLPIDGCQSDATLIE